MPFCPQVDSKDCGAACLQMISAYYGRQFSNQAIRDLCNQDRLGMSLNGIARGAEKIGFRTVAAKVAFEALKARPILPCVAYWRTGHFVVVYRVHKGKVYVADPSLGLLTFPEAEFQELWIATVEKGTKFGVVLLLEPTPSFYEVEIDGPEKRRFSALKPYLSEYKRRCFNWRSARSCSYLYRRWLRI
jgi:ATP-binding cassette subfamily B protein